MRNDKRNDRDKSKINPEDDGLNRTFFGGPTIGGLIVIVIIVIYSFFSN